MGNTVVATTSNNYAVVSETTTAVVVDGKTPVIILSGQIGPPGPSGSLSAMSDVDLTSLQPNSLLIYDASSQKWKAGKNLEDHLVNAGFF